MKPGLQQSASLRQELKINPRLYQAMDLLYMPLLDLQQHLSQELLVNPFLELIEPGDDEEETPEGETEPTAETQDLTEPEATPAEEPEKAGDDDVDWEAVLLDGFETGGMREQYEEREYVEPVRVDVQDLSDHLREQVALLDLTARQEALADEFLGNINEDGYLACSLEEIRDGINEVIRREAGGDHVDDSELPLFTIEECERMLRVIQDLDPPGVAARDLRECLLLQLTAAGQGDSLAAQLVRDAFDELRSHRWSELAKRYGVPQAALQDAADEIKKL
ncbi:MAG: hypothetical protein MUF00_18040, partial [Gemmatimonadaceae bacterium]|nr:hypothetical protein [Gemmatimonadaceae bacterium]